MSRYELFLDAVMSLDFAAAELMLAEDPALINSKGEFGFTALHELAGEQSPACLDWLLRNGADVHATNEDGLTPLHLGISRRSCLDMFLKKARSLCTALKPMDGHISEEDPAAVVDPIVEYMVC